MKKCFLELVDNFAWGDENDRILSDKQMDCIQCGDVRQCYQFSLARAVGRVLIQMELINHLPEVDEDNGDTDILDVEDN